MKLSPVNWRQVERVFLDMDGTLLDLHFDNHFWMHHVPTRYAEQNGLDFETAKNEVLARYKKMEGQLEWYCLDHWSDSLDLDIALLKEEVDHLIKVHPHVLEFLELLKKVGKRRVLVTNAHQKALQLKMERTSLAGHLDAVVCAHDLHVAKEDPSFWRKLQRIEPFDPRHTLFVDDNLSVLKSAKSYGFNQLLAITKPDSKEPSRQIGQFPSIKDFSELIPGLQRIAVIPR